MYKVMCGKKERNKQTLDDEFHGGGFPLTATFFLCCPTILAKYSSLARYPAIYKDAWLVAVEKFCHGWLPLKEKNCHL